MIKTRCQIILLEASPMSVPQLAQVIYDSEDTVARCIHEFNQSRWASLLPSPKGGRPPQVTPDYLQRLLSIIEQVPRRLRCPFSNWTAPLLAEYLAEVPQIRLDESRIRHYLHAHAYSLLRPVLTVASPDPEYDSKRARIEDLQRQAEAGTIDLYYENEIDLALLPTLTHCWCKRGHQRKIETPRKNQKHSGAGLSQVLEPSDGVPRRKAYVVVDNYRIHFAKPVLAKFSTRADRIELVTLPTYSPQLNPVERFWKHLRRKVTHTTFFQTIDRLLDAVTGLLRDMAASPQTVRAARRMSRVGLTSCLRSREQDDAHPTGAGGG
jgi:putative transposase